MDRLAPPSAKHLLGADGAGRDILTRLIHGARISLVVGLAATTVTIVVAAAIGVPSGYLGGRYDIVVQRFVDGWMAFPGLLVLLTVMSIVGRGTLQIIVVLGILYGIHNSRVLRSAVIVIKENDYIAAAAATGNRKLRTVLRHVLPNIVAPVIIIYSINIGYIVLDEAALSFHLALCVRRRIGGRTKFDDEVGTQRQESPLLFGGEPRQTTAQYPGHVR